MTTLKQDCTDSMIRLIQTQTAAAVGCTEPAAVAFASALAAEALGEKPETIDVGVSRNILKNAMGVGIPGTGMVGLPVASALGALAGDPKAELAVLHAATDAILLRFGTDLHEGRVPALPVEENGRTPCEYCDYAAVCGKEADCEKRSVAKLDHAEARKALAALQPPVSDNL